MLTSVTLFASPGSNRTAVPAGMFSLMPYALCLSKTR
uniref:URE n=1 Tax=Arundo donax TaxID=35708 RepID=A0A0A9GYD4_ARUDO